MTELNFLLTTEQVAKMLGCHQQTLIVQRRGGGGPPFVRIGAKSVRYRLSDINQWLDTLVTGAPRKRGRPKKVVAQKLDQAA